MSRLNELRNFVNQSLHLAEALDFEFQSRSRRQHFRRIEKLQSHVGWTQLYCVGWADEKIECLLQRTGDGHFGFKNGHVNSEYRERIFSHKGCNSVAHLHKRCDPPLKAYSCIVFESSSVENSSGR